LGFVALGGEDLALGDELDADVLDIKGGELLAIGEAGDGARAHVHDGEKVAPLRDIDVGDFACEACAGEEDEVFDGKLIGPIDVGLEVDFDFEPLLGPGRGVLDGAEIEGDGRGEINGGGDFFDIVIRPAEGANGCEGKKQEACECG